MTFGAGAKLPTRTDRGSFDRVLTRSARWLVLLALASCGGGHTGADVTPQPPGRGTLLQNPPQLVATVTASALLAELTQQPSQQLLALGALPLCDILVYHLEYTTVGGADEATTASAALMVPVGLDAKCSGSRPIALYAHGSTTDRAFDIANVQDSQNTEGLLLTAFFATQGYIVVAPNYAGYDSSTLPYHPYLVADQQSKDMIDALTAARSALPLAAALITRDSGRLFITGYSEGGYVVMATHRAMQAAGIAVTASAPMSGPYAVAAFVDAVFEGEVNDSGPVSMILLFSGYQHSYGNFYASAAQVYEPQYAPGIEALLPSITPRSVLYALGKLPSEILFSASPPAPAYAKFTPATTPPNLAPVFARGFFLTSNLVTNAYRLAYLDDAQRNPDGGWPMATTGLATTTAGLAARQALARNDLRGWTPSAPTLLCGGNADPAVFWLNTKLMQDYWASRSPAPASVHFLDVDSAVTPSDPYASLKQQFAIAKDAIAAAAIAHGVTDGGAAAVAAAYHGLVSPFCLAAVTGFFAAQ